MVKKFFKNKIVRVILWLHLIAIVAISILFFYIKTSNNDAYQRALKNTPYDVIIVPGYPYKGQWHDIMKTRIYWSKYLLEQGYAKHIIYSGSAVYSPYVESLIMKQYAISLGVQEEVLFAETNAEHSTENLFYSYKLAKDQGFDKIALATDPIQSFFLELYADGKPFDIEYLPIQYGILKQMNLADVQIDTKVAFKENFEALPEREGFWKRLRGTMGKNVKGKALE